MAPLRAGIVDGVRAILAAVAVLGVFFAVLLGGGLLLGVWEAEPAASSARQSGKGTQVVQRGRASKKRVGVLGAARKKARRRAVGGQRQQRRFNHADQAAARAAVLRRGDFAPTSGWRGGRQKVRFAGSPCANFRPKRSDLVVTGAAASRFTHSGGVTFASEAEVMQTREMLERDWQRTVANRGFVRCLRIIFAKEAKNHRVRVVSLKQIRFPRLARYMAAFRLLVDVRVSRPRVRVISDLVLVGGNRTELTFTAAAPHASRAALFAAERRLLRRLLSRTKA